ncbi:phospholipase D-like domain-containing protein [Streptomyces sp. NPDC005426]|uniref:phospholipase D-like domain-containing protein n=1 Tax=Streptomyces sp. NPDC005426 TaxID=3155344 RepID=UPI0033B5E3D0
MRRFNKSFLVAGVSAGLLVGSLPAFAAPTGTSAPAAAVVPVPPSEVRDYTWFNTKQDAADMHAGVAQHVQRLIDAASPGATLSLTLYYFSRTEIVQALRNAAARGVRVRVVVDGWMVHDPKGIPFYKALKAIPSIRVVECDLRGSGEEPVRACMSNRTGSAPLSERPVMHNKFMTISSVQLAGGGTAKGVLYVSSANLDHYAAYEDALTVTHAGLYKDYVAYFEDLMHHGSRGSVNNNYGKTFSANEHRVYTFPRMEAAGRKPRSATNDPIADILRRTPCGSSQRTQIDLANFRIQRRAVVSELIAAQARGCKVRIVTGDDAFAALKTLARAMPVRLCGHTDAGGMPVHEKFMILRRGTQSTLYVGSHNLTYRALRQNDEAILALRNHAIAGPYKKRFDYLHAACNRWDPSSNVAPATDN